MVVASPQVAPGSFSSFGALLRFMRRRARLTQAELGIAVGYSDAQICRLETGRRPPDLTTLIALFFPALEVDPQSELARRLLELAASARADQEPAPERPAEQAGGAPPPAAAEAPNLPHPATPLVGRGAERASLAARLTGDVRLLTLIGPPGIGKTRLALQVAHDLAPRFADGACFADLSAVSDAAQVPSALAQALGLSEEAHTTAEAALCALLQARSMLLVIDNFEQVADAAPLLQALLSSAPRLTLLVTSRVALRLAAEHTLMLPPLPVPDLERLPPLEELAGVDAMALLLARLRAHTPELELTPQHALPLAAICVRVDGIPLAIELVAAHGRLFTPQALLGEVAQHFLQLRRRGRDIPSRHQTLQAALGWSYEQLPAGAQALLLDLGVFAAGWTLEAALAVCDTDGAGRAALLEDLETLLDHSLIQRQPGGAGMRMTMLAMVQEYARAHLAPERRAALHDRLLAYLTELAEQVVHHLNYGSEQATWLARMAAEQENMRAALQWALASRQHALALRLAAAIGRFWYARGALREARRWLEKTLDAAHTAGQALDTAEHARALNVAGMLAWRQGQYAEAEQRHQRALAIVQRIGQEPEIARIQMHLGLTAFDRGQLDTAVQWYEQSLRYYRAVGDRTNAAIVLHNLGNLYCMQNECSQAQAIFEECLESYEALGDHSGIALILLGVGTIARGQGDPERALAAFTRSYELARELGEEWTAANALINFGDLAADRGAYAEARRWLHEAIAHFEPSDDPQGLSLCQLRLGAVEVLDGRLDTAATLFRQSLVRSQAIGHLAGVAEALEGLAACAAAAQPLLAARLLAASATLRAAIRWPFLLGDLPRYQRALGIARGAADPAAWDSAWADGERLSAAQAVELALAPGGN